MDLYKHDMYRSKVDVRILSFGPMIEDVHNNRFNIKLPASFKLSSDDEVDPVPGQPPHKWKKEDTKKGKDLRIKNPNKCKDFATKEGES